MRREDRPRPRPRHPEPAALGLAWLLLGGCADEARRVDTRAEGALLHGAVVGDDQLAVAGYTGLDAGRRALVQLHDPEGRVRWSRSFGQTGGAPGLAQAIAAGPGGTVVSAGHVGSSPTGVVAAWDGSGRPLWERRPWTAGPSDLTALAVEGDAVVVTGFARSGAREQGVLLARLAAGSGALAWLRVLEAREDRVGLSHGTSVHLGPSGRVGVTGLVMDGQGRPAWYAAVFSPEGEPVWTDLRSGTGGEPGPGLGEMDLAFEGRFDGEGNLYVVGQAPERPRGTDIQLRKYGPAGGILWELRRGAGAPGGKASHDRGSELAVAADRVWLGGTLARGAAANPLLEGYALSLDGEGRALWERDLGGGASVAGEEVLDLVADSSHAVYLAGFVSREGHDKDPFVEKLAPGGEVLWAVELVRPAGEAPGDHDALAHLVLGTREDLFVVGSVHLDEAGRSGPAACRLDGDGRRVWCHPPDLDAVRF